VHSTTESRSEKGEFRNEELRGRRRRRSCSCLRTRERQGKWKKEWERLR